MKRKIPAPRNPFVAAAKFRKAGAHTKPHKALRRAEKIEIRGYGRVARHRTFNPAKDEFESLCPHPPQSRMHSPSAFRIEEILVGYRSG